MRQVLECIATKKRETARHALFAWLRDPSVSPVDRLAFAPVFAPFILGFRDMNRWFLRYPEPTNAYQAAISAHTREDATHAALFVEDFRKLGFDSRLGWAASDAIRSFYAAPETQIFREFALEILGYCARQNDPWLRFPLMESIEACGHVFFSASAEAAAAHEVSSGVQCRYFGHFHLARETGHLVGAGQLFEPIELDEPRRTQACVVVLRIFEMFWLECDQLLSVAREAREQGQRARASRVVRESPAAARLSPGSLSFPSPPSNSGVSATEHHPSQREVLARLEARLAAAEQHPFFGWMQAADGLKARHKLQRFLALWVPDVMGYRDLNVDALSYRKPAGPRERAICRVTAKLSTHHSLFLNDWRALEMDALLGWSASDTLSFCSLSAQTELQRSSMASFVKLAFRHPEPLLRHWLIQALEASGDAFFRNTELLARRAEAESGLQLDYLANRHALTHPVLEPDPEAEAVRFANEPMEASARKVALEMIDTVFENLDRQYSLSLKLARENFFRVDVQALDRGGSELQGRRAALASFEAGAEDVPRTRRLRAR